MEDDQPMEDAADELLLVVVLGRRGTVVHVVVGVPVRPDAVLALLPPLTPFATLGVNRMLIMIESTNTIFITFFIFFLRSC